MRLSHETANALIRLSINVASKDQTRYHLTFVEMKKIDNDYIELAATDGHIAVWVKIKDTNLASTLLKTPYYFNRDNAELLKVLVKGSFAWVDCDKFEKDIKFPNLEQFRIKDTKWTETIYKEKAPPEIVIDRSFTIGLSSKLLGRIEKAFAPTKSSCFKFIFDTRDNGKPALILGGDGETAVIMPMRV